jgi:hypothetical protein
MFFEQANRGEEKSREESAGVRFRSDRKNRKRGETGTGSVKSERGGLGFEITRDMPA